MRWTSRRIFRWLVRTYNVYSNNVLPPFVLSTSSFNKHTHARCHHFIRRNTFTASFSLSSLPHFNELRSWKPFFRLIVNMAQDCWRCSLSLLLKLLPSNKSLPLPPLLPLPMVRLLLMFLSYDPSPSPSRIHVCLIYRLVVFYTF